MSNEPLDKTPEQSREQRSESLITRPATLPEPAVGAGETSYFKRRREYAIRQWREHKKVELIATTIGAGVAAFVIGSIAGGIAAGVGVALLTFIIALAVIYVAHFLRAPARLDEERQAEIDALKATIKEQAASIVALESELDRTAEHRERDMSALTETNRKLSDATRDANAAKERVETERDALQAQLEKLTKHKLIFEIDARTSRFFLQERSDKRVVVLAEIRLHFVNKDVHPWSMMSLDLSLHDLQEGVDIFTLWSAQYSSNGVEIEREQFEGMLVQAGRTTPFYLFEAIMNCHDNRVQAASDLLKGLHCLRLTMEANNNQPPLTATLLLSWEDAMKEEGAYLTIVLGAPSIGRVNQRLD